MNAIIACGGTGGHLFPGLAVAEVLRERGHEVLLFVSEKDVDALALKEHPEIPFEKLPTIGLPSPFSPAILGFVRRFNESFRRCRSIYRRFKPQVILGMGGFQGASGINQAMIKSLPSLDGARLQVIHLTGTRDEKLVADNYRRAKLPAFVAAFHHRMEELYSAADFAVARSGAASLAELAAFALPAILIPFPYAADDHQARNAEVFVKADAAILVKESDILDDALAHKILLFIEDRD